MRKYENCSLCGKKTDIPVGSARSRWYLCTKCVGTEEAEKAGFTHRNKYDILEEKMAKRGISGALLAAIDPVDFKGLPTIDKFGNEVLKEPKIPGLKDALDRLECEGPRDKCFDDNEDW